MMQNNSPNYFSDVQIQFTDEELKAVKLETKKRLSMGRFLKVPKMHFFIYAVSSLFGILLVIPYIFINCSEAEKTLSATMSIGAGIISAVVLAYFIEWSNTILSDKKAIKDYNYSIESIHMTLWRVFMCKSLNVFRGNETKFKNFLDQNTEMYISYYEIAFKQIDNHIQTFGDLINDEKQSDLSLIKEQLIKFVSDMKNPSNPEHCLLLLEGTKTWLKGHCTKEWLKKQLLVY